MDKNTPLKSPFSSKLIHIGIVVRDMDNFIERLSSMGIGPFRSFEYNPPIQEMLPYRGKPFNPDVNIYVAKKFIY